MEALAVSLRSDVHAAAPADRAEVSERDFYDELANQLQRMTVRDLLEELGECDELLHAAIAKRDAGLIGRIVLAVKDAKAVAMTERELGLEPAGFDTKRTAELVVEGTL